MKDALILKQRAEKLAMRLTDQNAVQDNLIEAVEFRLQNESYAIESRYIQEVYPLKDYTPLPCVPPFVYGIINVRRKIVSLINLKVFFDFPEHQEAPTNKVIIIYNGDIEFGILVDEIIGVRRIIPENIQTSLPSLTGLRQDFFKGIYQPPAENNHPDKLILLDGEKLLTNKKIVLNAAMEGVQT